MEDEVYFGSKEIHYYEGKYARGLLSLKIMSGQLQYGRNNTNDKTKRTNLRSEMMLERI